MVVNMITNHELETIRSEKIGGGLGDANGLSWAFGLAMLVGEQEVEVTDKDRDILRELAKEVAEIAAKPEQHAKLLHWQNHNMLEETLPLVFCDPESAWYEIIPAKTLKCKTPLARIWEFKLRKELYWARVLQDDRPILARFAIQTVFHLTSRGLEHRINGSGLGHAYRWDAPLTDTELLDALVPQRLVIDKEKTNELLTLAKEIFGGILSVCEEGVFWWSFGLTSDVIYLRGLEQMMVDIYDNPAFLHKLMSFLCDEAQQKLTFLEEGGYLTPNVGIDFIGTGGYGFTQDLPQEGMNLKLMDLWGYSESQETVGISPNAFEEFIFPYQNSILKRFGLNIYGCCEPLERRWNTVSQIDRLRRVTVSPWSDVNIAAQQLGKKYVYVRKVNPSYMALPDLQVEPAREQLRETFKATKANGCPAEVLLRDVITLGGNPNNAVEWVKLARSEAAKIYG